MRLHARSKTGRHRRPPGTASIILAAMTAMAAMVLAAGTAAALTARAPALRAAGQGPAVTAAVPAAAAAVPAARAAAPRTYTVRPGDTLSAIALRYCGHAGAWPALARASRIADGNLIMPGWRVVLACGAAVRSGGAAARDGDSDYDHDTSDASAPPASRGSLSGTLSYAGLEALWRAAGGAGWAAPTAACIAEHESSGQQYATGSEGERGYWQIHPVNGSLSTYDPYGNARAAIILSHDGTDWSAWTTHYACGVAAVTGPGQAPAVTLAAYYESPGARALDWAEAHALGCWYAWGGTGPCSAGYDCSGLVWASVLHADGILLPRDTYGMLAGSPRLYWVPLSQIRRGDLLFFGSGHVEFATIWYHVSFGAHHSGTTVGWRGWNDWWAPTMALRVR